MLDAPIPMPMANAATIIQKMRIRTGTTAIVLLSALLPVFSESLPIPSIRLPAGFEIRLITDKLPGARQLAVSPEGIIFAGTRDEGTVYAVDTRETPARVHVIARDLKMPNGVAYRNGALFVGEIDQLRRYDGIAARLSNPPKPKIFHKPWPDDEYHGAKFIRWGPDGFLYAGIGVPCNVCVKEEPFGTILRLRADGSSKSVFARGVRNTVGFDWHPKTGELWFTDNGRDYLGDDSPPDELNHAPRAGMHFGFPYCQAGDIVDPDFGKRRSCAEFTAPAQKLGPHVASLGMRFYTGKMFPETYRGDIFIAEHGSWNRSKPIGYRITRVRIEKNAAVGYEVFAEGWLTRNGPWGRPVDVDILPDGSLLISDDHAGALYRVTYRSR
jgi:glucose/arabinose dehydrogenase